MILIKRLEERAFYEAMNIKNKMETKSMLVETIHKWGEEIRNEGKTLWFKKGEREKAIKTAKKLLAMNHLTIEQIADATELSMEEVSELKAS